jgi:hypothetical protein
MGNISKPVYENEPFLPSIKELTVLDEDLCVPSIYKVLLEVVKLTLSIT